jgi:hypothetical protein
LESFGDSRFNDYPTYIKTKGKEYADKRKELYYLRHGRDKGEKYSKDWLAKTPALINPSFHFHFFYKR